MASVLRHIKAIKLSAYETPITNTALTLRDNEIHCLREWIKEILKVSIFTNYNSNFLSLITVTTYTLVSLFGGGGVSTAKIFTTVTTIALISEPLLMLGQQLGNIVSAWASWKRVEEFLLSEEKEVHPVLSFSTRSRPWGSASRKQILVSRAKMLSCMVSASC
jgi:ATP-binding cassette subfamily C (CFTR/MRP) protein 1